MTTSKLTTTSRQAGNLVRGVAVAALTVLTGTAAQAAPMYVAYPGSYPATVATVETAARAEMNVLVWPGFARVLHVTLPGIDIPKDTSSAPACERKLAQEAKKFTQSFLASAKKIQVHDIQMQDTGTDIAQAPIFTEAGSLSEALKTKGFARDSSAKPAKPWCVD